MSFYTVTSYRTRRRTSLIHRPVHHSREPSCRFVSITLKLTGSQLNDTTSTYLGRINKLVHIHTRYSHPPAASRPTDLNVHLLTLMLLVLVNNAADKSISPSGANRHATWATPRVRSLYVKTRYSLRAHWGVVFHISRRAAQWQWGTQNVLLLQWRALVSNGTRTLYFRTTSSSSSSSGTGSRLFFRRWPRLSFTKCWMTEPSTRDDTKN